MRQTSSIVIAAVLLAALPALAGAASRADRPDADPYSHQQERVYGGPAHQLTPTQPQNEGLELSASHADRRSVAPLDAATLDRNLLIGEQSLEGGRYRNALYFAESALEPLIARGHGRDPATAQLAGRALLLKALAEQGLRRGADALSHLEAAYAVDPGARLVDLRRYGKPGEKLLAAWSAQNAGSQH